MPWRLFSAAVSAYGVHQQNKNIDKQIAAQERENALTRKYNLQLAKMQNKWNRQQWQMENAYNSPSAQIQRMRAAGLNPDMMYGGGVSGNLSASSPSMTSGVPGSPMDFTALGSKRPISDAVSSYLDTQLKQAQIDNINADTNKKGAEASILSSDAAFRDALNQGQLDLQNVQIKVQNKGIELTDAQIKEAQARLTSIEAEVGLFKATAAKIRKETQWMDALNQDIRKLNDATLKKLAAETNLTFEQAKRLKDELPYIIRNWDDQHNLNLGELGNLTIRNGMLEFEAAINGPDGYDEDLSGFDNVIKFLTKVLNVLPLGKVIN